MPRISLVGGCPVDGGYLGIPECLPSVRAPLSTKVELVSVEPKQTGSPIRLVRGEQGSDNFAFPVHLESNLDGRFRLVGSHEHRVLVQKEIIFRPEIVVNAYPLPTDRDAWLAEAGGPDVITCGEAIEETVKGRSQHGLNENGGNAGNTPHSEPVTGFASRTGLRDWQRFKVPILPAQCDRNVSHNFTAASRLMEICGGLAIRRKGIPEGEVLDLFRKTLSINGRLIWDVVRGWVEAGYLDRLMYRKWRRTDYFPRTPRFVLNCDNSDVRGALSGLATNVIRGRADIELLEKGAKRIESSSFSEWIPPVPMWVAANASTFEEVSKSLALEQPTWVGLVPDVLWPLAEIVSCNQDPPRFYDCWGCWNWGKGWFEHERKPTGNGIEVARLLHAERPPLYQVLMDGEHVWWSKSRNWALLLAHDLMGIPCFAFSGSDQVVRSTNGQVYLPLPIGRHLSSTCPLLSGPVSDRTGGYCYQFRDSSERSRLLSAIWGGFKIPVGELRRWGQWMLGMSRRFSSEYSGRSLPLPLSIRNELDRFPEIPEFRELSRTKFDHSLLPRLKEGLSRFIKGRED